MCVYFILHHPARGSFVEQREEKLTRKVKVWTRKHAYERAMRFPTTHEAERYMRDNFEKRLQGKCKVVEKLG